jgi:cytidine deaminase
MDSQILKKAVETALNARNNAHVPYSGFKVGAAVITRKGEVFAGVNVENSSFGATVCAERIALFSAVTQGCKEDIEAVVIASVLDGKAVFPCGICRQVLADFNPEMKIILVNADTGEIEKELSLESIFPDQFKF